MKQAGFFQRSVLGRCMWTFRKEFFWVVVFSMFANLLMLTPTLYMLQVFDRVLVSGSETTLLALSAIAIFFFLVMGFAEWIRSRLLVRAGARLDEALNTQLFKATFEAALARGSRNPQQPFNDLTQVRQFLTGPGIFALVDTPWTPVYLGVLFLMHPWLGWTAMFFMLPMALLAVLANRLTAPRYKKAMTSSIETNAYLHSKLRNAETVEALGMLGNLRRQWLALYEKQMATLADVNETSRRIQALTKFVQYTQQSLILAVGAVLAIDGKIGVGAMVASNALMGNALRPFANLVGIWKGYVDAKQAYGRLEALLEAHPDRPAARDEPQVKGQVSLRGLVATAAGREAPILRGLDADFKAGEVVAIVGPSGAGKSTLARCLMGIWPEVQGQVLLDGISIADWSREALGPHLGYLPQDIELFDGSIAENISRFGKLDAEAVIDAATRTGIHDMILRFPKGYDTSMGEAGALLSAGQRQRIGLARAIYGDPMLIVLDEPNASLDDAGEAALIKTVRELRARGRTVFMIVHQRHLLSAADRVLLLDAGRITRLGPLAAAVANTPLKVQA